MKWTCVYYTAKATKREENVGEKGRYVDECFCECVRVDVSMCVSIAHKHISLGN